MTNTGISDTLVATTESTNRVNAWTNNHAEKRESPEFAHKKKKSQSPNPPLPPDAFCSCCIMFCSPPMPPICCRIRGSITEIKNCGRIIIPMVKKHFFVYMFEKLLQFTTVFQLLVSLSVAHSLLAICWLSCAILAGFTFFGLMSPVFDCNNHFCFPFLDKAHFSYLKIPRISIMLSYGLKRHCLK